MVKNASWIILLIMLIAGPICQFWIAPQIKHSSLSRRSAAGAHVKLVSKKVLPRDTKLIE